MRFSVRACTLDDVPAILAVVHASDVASVGEPDFTAEEVLEILTAPGHDPQRDSWLAVLPDDQAVAWAYLHNPTGGTRDLLDVYAHPQLGRAAQGPLLELALARVAQRARQFGYPALTARSGAIATERHWIRLLEAAGFTFIKRYARMSRELADLEQPPAPPAGITIREVRPDDDAELRAFFQVIKDAFADIPDSIDGDYEVYRAGIAAAASVVWDEWFVAEADGRIVGALQSSGQGEAEDEGWVKYLGVAREHRGRGLGRLLLLTAFARYAEKGRTRAGLVVDMTNPTSAYRLYDSVGLRPTYESDVYEREVAAA